MQQNNDEDRYSLGAELVVSSSVERGLLVLVISRFNMSQQCNQHSIASWSKEMILPLYLVLVLPNVEY